MRILFTGTKPGGGGAETHLAELARAVSRAGHHVAAFVRPGGAIDTMLQGSDVRSYYGKFQRSNDPVASWALLRAAREFRPDWIFASFTQEYGSAAAVARVCRAHTGFFEHTDLPRRSLTRFLMPRVSEVLFVPSEYLRSHLIQQGMPADRITVMHNPIDTDRLHPDAELRMCMRKRLGFSDNDVVIGYVGRVENAKGSDVLAAASSIAMGQDPRVRALWVGEGKYAEELNRVVSESGFCSRHVWTGWVPNPAPYYAAMDALALPTTKSETFGRSCAEAQACGVPVLGSDLGGIRETLAAGTTGLLIPPGDVAAWAAAILRMTDNDLRTRLAKRAPGFAAFNFGAQHIVGQFIAHLEELVV